MAAPTKIFLADWKGEVGSRRTGSPTRATIRADGAESADIPLSDRERAEGFHLTIVTTVAVAVTAQIVTSTPCTDHLGQV